MRSIILHFLTKKGVDAYKQTELEGGKQSWKDRAISNAVATDSVISEDPFIVKVKVKISWLGEKINLPFQIKQGLKKFGAKEKRDYLIEVIR